MSEEQDYESEERKVSDQQETRLGQHVGEYRLVRKLGGGGFGTVYLAEHVHKHTQVAVKVLSIPLTKPGDFKDFLNEVRMVLLRHPHIVPLLDFGISRGDLPFLVMEYAPKGTLRDRHPKGERISLSTIVSYVDQLASALQYAHDQRVIHRDVKPENILVRADGTVLMSDFGIAKLLEQSVLLSAQTQVGTPVYMAPEQYRGYPCFASDQYALAVVIYEWICGTRPFQGPAMGLAVQHMDTPPPRLRDHIPELSESIEYVILKALAKVPEDRFGRIEGMAFALREAVQPPPSTEIVSFPKSDTDPELETFRGDASLENDSSDQEKNDTEAHKPSEPESLDENDHSQGSHHQTLTQDLTDPESARLIKPKRRPVVLVLIFLILVLIGAGSLGIYTATADKGDTSLGRAWHTQASGISQELLSVGWSGSQFVVVGDAGTILRSPDRNTWTPRISGTSHFLVSVASSGSRFVVVGTSGTILTSSDGNIWTPRTSGTSWYLYGLAWSGSQFVVVGEVGTILTSLDGITWTPRTSSTSQDLYGIAWSGSQFVVVGTSGTVLTSSDGITWTSRTSGTSQDLGGIACSVSLCVVVGGGTKGIVLTSPDGITWTPRISGTSQYLSGVAWSGSQFVVVGTSGTILTSSDRITWTSRTSGTSQGLYGIACSVSLCVVVGAKGTVLTSP